MEKAAPRVLAVPQEDGRVLVVGSKETLSRARNSTERLLPELATPLEGAFGEALDQVGVEMSSIVTPPRELWAQLQDDGPTVVGLSARGQLLVSGAIALTGVAASVAGGPTGPLILLGQFAGTAGQVHQTALLERQLESVQKSLKRMERKAAIRVEAELESAVNNLEDIWKAVHRRGRLTSGDWARIAAMQETLPRLHIQSRKHLEALQGVLGSDGSLARLARDLQQHLPDQDLEFWLKLQVEAEIAWTKWERLALYHEMQLDPAAAAALAVEQQEAADERRRFVEVLAEGVRDRLEVVEPPAGTSVREYAQLQAYYRFETILWGLQQVDAAYRAAFEHAALELVERPGPPPQLRELAGEHVGRVSERTRAQAGKAWDMAGQWSSRVAERLDRAATEAKEEAKRRRRRG